MTLVVPTEALVQYLLTCATAYTRTLIGANRIYGTPGVPSTDIEFMPRKCVTVALAGGSVDQYIHITRASFDINCYGETPYQSELLYQALKEDLRRNLNNQVAVTGPGVAFMYAVHELSPGFAAMEPEYHWPRVFSTWRVQYWEDRI